MKKIPPYLLVLVGSLILSSGAKAQYLLDTGTPSGSLSDVISSSSTEAVEFSLTAGENLQQISVYLTPGSQNYQNQFLTLQLFSSSITTRNHAGAVDSFQLQYTGSGWNTTAANYVALTSGNYWLTVATATSGYTLDAPTEATNPSGTAPALAFAYSSNGGTTYTQASGTTASFGVQIGTATAPEPATWALLFGGLGLLAFTSRRLRQA
jgi:hypothetical protein